MLKLVNKKFILTYYKLRGDEILICPTTLAISDADSFAQLWENEGRCLKSFGKLIFWNSNTPVDIYNWRLIKQKQKHKK